MPSYRQPESVQSVRGGAPLWCAVVLCLPVIATAQEAPSAKNEPLEELVVVGSRIASDVPPENGALPLAVIDGSAISAAGAQSLDEYLHTNPLFSGMQTGDNNSNAANNSYAALNLWGLGSRYTLVLVNGQRFSADGPANFNAIPMAAIERVEVLKAGAGAIYGSDAVAGVVNIVTKTSGSGLDVYVSQGNVTQGHAPITEISASMGSSGDEGHWYLTADHYNRGNLDALDVPVFRSNNFSPYGWFDVRSSYTTPASFAQPGTGNMIIFNTGLAGRGQVPTSTADFRAVDFDRDAYDRPEYGEDAISALERNSFYLGASRPILGGEIFVDGIYAKERLLLRTGSATVDLSSIGGVPASNPWNVFGTAVTGPFLWRPSDMSCSQPGPDGCGDQTYTDRRTARISAGFRTTLAEAYKLEVTGGIYSLDVDIEDGTSISLSGLQAALNRTDSTALNPFCNLCNTAAQYAGVQVSNDVQQHFRMPMATVGLTGPLFAWSGGQAQFAVGAEYRQEQNSQSADAATQTGGLADTGAVTPYYLHRNVTSGYAEFHLPLLAGAAGADPRLELAASGRFEHYSDFGGKTTPMVSLRWDAVPSNVVFRASYAQSYKAPLLTEIAPSPAISTDILPDPKNGNAPTRVEIISGGNPDLKAETARTVTLGVVFTPAAIRNLRVSLDLLDIRQKGLVEAPSAIGVLEGNAPGTVLRGSGIGIGGRDIIIEALLANVAERRMREADLESSYAIALPANTTMTLGLSATYILQLRSDLGDGNGLQNYAGEYSDIFGGMPKLRTSAEVDVAHGGFTAQTRMQFVNSYLDDPSSWEGLAPTPTIPSYFRTDVNLSYAFGHWGKRSDDNGITVSVGVKNLFDRQAPFVAGGLGYDAGVADIYGRFWHASLAAKF